MFEFILLVVGIIGFLQLSSRISQLEHKLRQGGQNLPLQPSQPGVPQTQQVVQQQPMVTSTISATVPASPRSQTSAEETGGRWLGNIGILAVFIGIAFFLKYAFDTNLITITGRIILGFAAGALFMLIGHLIRKRYNLYSQILVGGGSAILYLTVFAAFAFYNLIDQPIALFIIALITALTVTLGILQDALSIGVIAILGGFLTPLLVSLEGNNVGSLFTYIALLDIGVLVASVRTKWLPLLYTAFCGTVLVFLAWFGRFYSADQLPITLSFLTLYFLLFLLSTFIRNLWKREQSTGGDIFFITANGLGYFILAHALLEPAYHSSLGFFSLLLTIVYFGLAYLSHTRNPGDRVLTLYLPGLATLFVTLAVWFQFSGSWITVIWFVEAVALFALGIYGNRPNYQIFASIVYAIGLIRLASTHLGVENLANFTPFANERFFLYVLAIVAAYLIGYFYQSSGLVLKIMDTDPRSIKLVFLVLANLLTIFLLTTEINALFNQQIMLQGVQTYSYSANSLRNESNTVISIFWTLYAVALIAIGFVFRSRAFRIFGLVFFFVTAFKIFIDIWSLGQLYRIVSSIIFGVIALVASFAFARYRERITSIINKP